MRWGGYNRSDLVQKLIEDLDDVMEHVFDLSDPISDNPHSISIESKIIKSEQYDLVRKWLAPEYRSLQPKLLYSGKKDGMDADSFHKNCDGKEPIVTLLKVKSLSDPSQVYTLGGFSDKAWHSAGGYIASQKAFLFSITKKLKCPLRDGYANEALIANGSFGPIFGESDLHVKPGFSIVTTFHSCYLGSSELTSQSGQWQLVDIEVFSLKAKTLFCSEVSYI